MAVIGEVIHGLSPAELLLQKVHGAVDGGNVPAHRWFLPHIVLKDTPEGFAEDHVLEIRNLAHDLFGKGVRYGTHEEGMSRLAVDDTLKDDPS